MAKKKTFPRIAGHDIRASEMTLRDHFALESLTSLLEANKEKYDENNSWKLCDLAYELADSMLIARAK
jgi:hypothetical protein